ncbi:hypothetical protein, partial [Escherichia coli]|uniref:hypothetical protein n=1 Tax=Escherichia coli TaxID=562 RepID=UPI001A8DE461
EKRVFLVILFTSFSGSLVSRISGAVHPIPNENIQINLIRNPDAIEYSSAQQRSRFPQKASTKNQENPILCY